MQGLQYEMLEKKTNATFIMFFQYSVFLSKNPIQIVKPYIFNPD